MTSFNFDYRDLFFAKVKRYTTFNPTTLPWRRYYIDFYLF